MIPVGSDVRVWVASSHTDLRKGMRGLSYSVRDWQSWLRIS